MQCVQVVARLRPDGIAIAKNISVALLGWLIW